MRRMNIHRSSSHTSEDCSNTHGQATSALPPSANSQLKDPPSVVPQLMNIYSDLAQSSTPQTAPGLPTCPSAAPELPSNFTRAVDMHSQQYERCTGQRGSNTSLSTIGKKVKASEMDGSTRSKQGISRKKGKTSAADQRWLKRFTWPDELHREFVSAIFDVGLKNSSPSALMEFMRPSPDLTSERVKSHLQKYRKNRDKSRQEFIASYDGALERMRNQSLLQQQLGGAQEDIEGTAGGSLSCGEPAAQCTYVSLAETTRESAVSGNDSFSTELGPLRSAPTPSAMAEPSSSLGQPNRISTEVVDGLLRMPALTSQEKCSHIGQAFGSLVELWKALSCQINDQRNQQQQESGNNHVQVSFPCPNQNKENTLICNQHGGHTQPLTHQYQLPGPGQQQQRQVYATQTSLIQPTVEQAAASAVSMQHAANNDPAIHEVAASIPHACLFSQQSSNTAGHATGGQHPWQPSHHIRPPQYQQHSQLEAGHHPSLMQQHPYTQVKHFLSHTNVSAGPSTPHNECIPQTEVQHPQQIMNLQGSTYTVPPPNLTVYTHSQQALQESQAPSNCVPPQRDFSENFQATYPPNEITTVLHPSRQPQPASTGQLTLSPQNLPLPRVATQQQQQQPFQLTRSNDPGAQSHIAKDGNPIVSPPSPSVAEEESSPPPNKSGGFTMSPASGPPAGARTIAQAKEESTIMKKDMCSQMEFQNKIRALKQIELSKYGGNEDQIIMDEGDATTISTGAPHHSSSTSQHEEQPEPVSNAAPPSPSGNQLSDAFEQGVFWNLEDDDDQVFDFLME